MNTDEATGFLDHHRPGGPWVLTAIIPDSTTTTETLFDESEVSDFVRRHEGKRNIYYSVLPTRGAVTKKATKKQIAAADFLQCDFDPEDKQTPEAAKAAALARLAAFPLRPSATIDSGNGIQALWRLQQPIPLNSSADIARVEAMNKRLIATLGGDKTGHNVDRIFRLPGTTNLPNAKKRSAGRKACPAHVIELTDFSYGLEELAAALPPTEPNRPGTPEDGGHHALQPPDLDDLIKNGDTDQHWPSRSHALFYAICEMIRRDDSDAKILEVILDRSNKISEHIYDQNDPQAYAEKQLRDALLKQPRRWVIQVKAGEISRMVDEAEAALIAARVPIMVRGPILVQPITDVVPASDGRKTEAVLLRQLSRANVIDLLNAHAARFVKWNATTKKEVPVDPPGAVADILLARGKWNFPKVVGTLSAPILRRDGSLLDRPGYDAPTQLWYSPPADFRLPPIPSGRGDAEQALGLLEGLLAGFPFASDLDRAVALSALMTGLLRGGMDMAPFHIAVSHMPGSGKSYLIDIVTMISTGRLCPVITTGGSRDELEKRLGALLLEGAQVVSLDNVEDDLGGPMLCQMTERPHVKMRVLGLSATPEFENRAALFATGNNVTVVGDMTRRTLVCNIDPHVERPELRHFEFSPTARIGGDRGRYVGAVLAIALAYLAAGSPAVCEPIASYGTWSGMVRAPLIWLGRPDPVGSMEQLRANDPNRAAIAQLFGYWEQYLQARRPYTAGEVAKVAMEWGDNERERPEFYDFLMIHAGSRSGNSISVHALGKWLGRIRGQMIDGRRLMMVHEDNIHGHRYLLE